MDDLNALECAGADFFSVKSADAAREFGAVQVADAYNVAFSEIAVATGHTGRQEAFTLFAQRVHRSLVHPERALGMMEKGNATFVALETAWARGEKGSLVIPTDNVGEDAFLFAGGYDHRDAGSGGHPGSAQLGFHAADGGRAQRAASEFFYVRIDLLDDGDGAGVFFAEVLDQAVHGGEDNEQVGR